jgi:hypothetical protein
VRLVESHGPRRVAVHFLAVRRPLRAAPELLAARVGRGAPALGLARLAVRLVRGADKHRRVPVADHVADFDPVGAAINRSTIAGFVVASG